MAGVSVGTVDRVLHDRGEVAAATRDQVLKIAKEGNYSTNVFARNLKLNKTYTLAVILPEDNEYWKAQRSGIVSIAEEYASLGMQLDFYTFDRHNEDSFMIQSKKALTSSPDGVIMAPLQAKEAKEICMALTRNDIPFVFVDSNLDGVQPLAFIGQDSIQSGFLAAKLLNFGCPMGHPSVIIRYTDFDSINKTMDERIAGFRKFYATNNFDPALIKEIEIESEQSQINENFITEIGDPLHLFVPNSRSHQIVKRIKQLGNNTYRLVGYDMIEENVKYLKEGCIDFLIHQSPKLQGNLAVQVFYKHLILKSDVTSVQFMPLDILTKENVTFATY